ncbi:MAG: hypothetical protein ACPIOQ_38400, partial [Promethearchaeia archaeon]
SNRETVGTTRQRSGAGRHMRYAGSARVQSRAEMRTVGEPCQDTLISAVGHAARIAACAVASSCFAPSHPWLSSTKNIGAVASEPDGEDAAAAWFSSAYAICHPIPWPARQLLPSAAASAAHVAARSLTRGASQRAGTKASAAETSASAAAGSRDKSASGDVSGCGVVRVSPAWL